MSRTQSFLTGAAGALALLVVVVGVAWAADIFTIDQNGNVRLVVTDAGNVGIGTTNPSDKLMVNGSIRIGNDVSAGLNLGRGDNASEGGQINWIPAGAYPQWTQDVFLDKMRFFNFSTTLANQVQIFTAGGSGETGLWVQGNVGVGTADPKTKLHVTGLPEYANNAAALAAGLTAGAFYRTGEFLKVVY